MKPWPIGDANAQIYRVPFGLRHLDSHAYMLLRTPTTGGGRGAFHLQQKKRARIFGSSATLLSPPWRLATFAACHCVCVRSMHPLPVLASRLLCSSPDAGGPSCLTTWLAGKMPPAAAISHTHTRSPRRSSAVHLSFTCTRRFRPPLHYSSPSTRISVPTFPRASNPLSLSVSVSLS